MAIGKNCQAFGRIAAVSVTGRVAESWGIDELRPLLCRDHQVRFHEGNPPKTVAGLGL